MMKNYSSKQAKKGKTAYRTPSDKRYQLVVRNGKRRLFEIAKFHNIKALWSKNKNLE